jgi:hypothetical protein
VVSKNSNSDLLEEGMQTIMVWGLTIFSILAKVGAQPIYILELYKGISSNFFDYIRNMHDSKLFLLSIYNRQSCSNLIR